MRHDTSEVELRCDSVLTSTSLRCSLIGMPPSVAKDALTVNPQRAVMRGRESFRSWPSSKDSFKPRLIDALLLRRGPLGCKVSLRQTYRGVISNPTLTTYRSLPSSDMPTHAAGESGKKRPADEERAGGSTGGTSEDKPMLGQPDGLGGRTQTQPKDTKAGGSQPDALPQQPKRKKKRKE